jgi:hypothetical protein
MTIYWEHDGEFYPDNLWPDYGAVILSWWIDSCRGLHSGSTIERFIFMEGSARLNIRNNNGSLIISDEDQKIKWNVTLQELTEELMVAAKEMSKDLAQYAPNHVDVIDLNWGVRNLRTLV